MGIHDVRFLLGWRSLASAFSVAMPTLVLEGVASLSARRHPVLTCAGRRIRKNPTDAIEGFWRRISLLDAARNLWNRAGCECTR
ncbi:hypothetical protein MPL3356_370005 [Mesorhizobium plurifarium]|uniref:Uncharacterized protein n=1 Tax=Mesorhizobium plurifarium TaxID=69974 RepID=A0A090GVK9_MESPL|nr:hypothetical protein MPL3356_370005 [Mesorhizobium plurifarium]CDX22386.1 hypothetical protein MPLB_2340006 [Mesorhizobium sp. ORS 3324]CDX37514.1 hypothetical protein MPLA_2060005 [Mesorhizobium sp. ORS 3359]CDX60447.1 hypothetical protein MPL3365_380008 [Mesorhizobium plurifarium]